MVKTTLPVFMSGESDRIRALNPKRQFRFYKNSNLMVFPPLGLFFLGQALLQKNLLKVATNLQYIN